MLYDPADLVRRHFSSGWGTFSYTYTYNPYAIKVTIHDLMIYVTMDPFSGYADPYINLYLYDGAGTETLVLAMSGGLQNNWKKSDVAPNTLLYLDAEMGRNYFYGLLYPGDYYFGIQIRDSDGILDDWIMDNAKTDYQKFEGKKLVSWGKSDS